MRGAGAGMRVVVDRQQTLGLDRGVALGRRQAGMAEQFLDRAQVAAGAEQVRRKAVAQRMRRRGRRQAEITAQCLHLPLHQARMQRPAARADKQRLVRGEPIRTHGEIVGDRLAHRRQHRQLAGLAALAGDRQRLAGRRLGAAEPQRLRQAQTAAIDQRQERRVALALPPRPRHLAGGVDRGDGVVDGQRLGYRGG